MVKCKKGHVCYESHVSSDEVVPVFDHSPGGDSHRTDFPSRSGHVFLQSITHMFSHTWKRSGKMPSQQFTETLKRS